MGLAFSTSSAFSRLHARGSDRRWAESGRTVMTIIRDGKAIGAVSVEDEIRPESVEAVRRLHELGVRWP